MATQSLSKQLKALSPDYEKEISKYASELKKQAQGNYDFIVKYLKQAHTQALGTDNAQRAEFYEAVANTLESQIGRIPFDFETKTAREKEDIANYLKRSELQKQVLNQQEEIFKEQQAFQSEAEQQQNAENFNSRGLLNSGLQRKEASRLEIARRLFETDPFNQNLTAKRAELAQQDSEALLQSGRNIQDIATGARRDAQDTQLTFDRGVEGAGRDLSAAKKQADIQASQARRSAITLLEQQKLAEEASKRTAEAETARKQYYQGY